MSKQIELTQNKIVIVDDEDFEYLKQWKWRYKKIKKMEYVIRTDKNDTIYMQQVIAKRKKIKSKRVYFKNKNHLDLRRNNIIGTKTGTHKPYERISGVQQKKRKNKYKGVYKYSSGFMVQITINKKNQYIGVFKSKKQAALAYDEAAKKQFGVSAVLKFSEIIER